MSIATKAWRQGGHGADRRRARVEGRPARRGVRDGGRAGRGDGVRALDLRGRRGARADEVHPARAVHGRGRGRKSGRRAGVEDDLRHARDGRGARPRTSRASRRTEGILSDWSLPGDHAAAAAYDVARTVCRRAERAVVRLGETGDEVNSHVVPYLNRLSDLLWLMGRLLELRAGLDTRLRDGEHTGPPLVARVVRG